MLQGLPELMVAPGAASPNSASARATVGSKTDDEPPKPRHASRRHGGSQPTPRCVGRRTEDTARVAIGASRAFVVVLREKGRFRRWVVEGWERGRLRSNLAVVSKPSW